MISMSFSNKIALVTGAGSGIGQAAALAFAAQGAQVIVADANETAANDTVSAINTAAGIALAVFVPSADSL